MSVPDAERERRLARRRLVRELHPDRGGDPEVYLAALAEFDARYGDPPRPARATEGAGAATDDGAGEVVFVRRRRLRWPARLRRRLRERRRRGWAQL